MIDDNKVNNDDDPRKSERTSHRVNRSKKKNWPKMQVVSLAVRCLAGKLKSHGSIPLRLSLLS